MKCFQLLFDYLNEMTTMSKDQNKVEILEIIELPPIDVIQFLTLSDGQDQLLINIMRNFAR